MSSKKNRAITPSSDEINISDMSRRLKLAKELIKDLKSYGPGDLIHTAILSGILKRVIRIWSTKGLLIRTIGNDRQWGSIDLEYEPSDSSIGHWSTKGDAESFFDDNHLNGCLFLAVGAQVSKKSTVLRATTVKLLKKNMKILVKQMDDITRMKKTGRLMIGGAKYDGRGPADARIVLDNSQNVYCAGCKQPGHPRGHASYPQATEPLDSVENYSYQGRKSGFLSREDQDLVAHFTLIHPETQNAIERLNMGLQSVTASLHAQQLQINGNIPKMKEFLQGFPLTDELNISRVTIVLRHHPVVATNSRSTDVFVHTFYPQQS